MTLDQIAAFAEIIASLGVVVSLIYVARQLRQSNKLMQIGAADARVQRDFDIANQLVSNREFAQVWLKGSAEGLASMDAVDQARVMFFNRHAILHWSNMFELNRDGLLPASSWQEMSALIRMVSRQQSLRETWQQIREGFDPAFRAFLDKELAASETTHA